MLDTKFTDKDKEIAKRLWVAIDFARDPKFDQSPATLPYYLTKMINNFSDIGVVLKFNSLLRFWGWTLYNYLKKQHDFKICADFKLNDVSDAMRDDASFWTVLKPDVMTVMCSSGKDGMKAVRETFSNETKIFAIPVLTGYTKENHYKTFGCNIRDAILRFAGQAAEAGIDGLIMAPKEISIIRKEFKDRFIITAAGIRPPGFSVPNDDQGFDRIGTLEEAVYLGANNFIVGRYITRSDNPRETAMAMIQEIKDMVS